MRHFFFVLFKSNPGIIVREERRQQCSVNALETAHRNSLLQRDSAGIWAFTTRKKVSHQYLQDANRSFFLIRMPI